MLCLNLFKEAKSTLSGRAFQTFRTRLLKMLLYYYGYINLSLAV